MDELSDLSRSSSMAIENDSSSSQKTDENSESNIQVENSAAKAEIAKV